MIYQALKGVFLTLLKAPSEPPTAPAGSPGSAQTFRASLNLLYFNMTVYLLCCLVPLGGALTLAIVATSEGNHEVATGLYIAFAVLGLICFVGAMIVRMEYDVRYYIVTDRSIRIREGIWTIREITLTFANVQDLEITRGPIDQLLGIGDLFVRTAGGAAVVSAEQGGAGAGRSHQAALRGIENATDVRDQISALLKRYRDAGLGDPEDARSHRAAVSTATGVAPLASPAAMALLSEVRDGLRTISRRRAGNE